MPAKKTKLEEITWNAIFLYLFENVIRIIGETKIAAELWTKLRAHYVTKIVPNMCYLLK